MELNKICKIICVRRLFFFSSIRMFREFCFSIVQKMVLCASAYDKFLTTTCFFFPSECFLLFRFVYDERNVATTMNEPVIVT
jgi:hypothetical protein